MVTSKSVGALNGEPINEFTIENGDLKVCLIEYGATIHNIYFKGVDCVQGYDEAIEYITGGSYQGATVGRYANRIGGAKFTLNGVEYKLDVNDHDFNCLHGGNTGFSKNILKGEKTGENSVTFKHFSKDGESGFPGNVEFLVTFTVEDNTLRLEYDGVSDKDTYLNFTNHVYFNLGAKDNKDIVLQVKADKMTPVDHNLVPTGELRDVTGTAFDFRTAKPIGKDLFADDPLIASARGFDHNLVLGDCQQFRRDVAVAYSPDTNITVKCSTDMPGIQIYTGNWLDEDSGKNGVILEPYAAFCLETQFFPDTPNNPSFPSALVKAGEHFKTTTEYKFL